MAPKILTKTLIKINTQKYLFSALIKIHRGKIFWIVDNIINNWKDIFFASWINQKCIGANPNFKEIAIPRKNTKILFGI